MPEAQEQIEITEEQLVEGATIVAGDGTEYVLDLDQEFELPSAYVKAADLLPFAKGFTVKPPAAKEAGEEGGK